jgi:thiol-disulfide isomerase/thioredoxin
MKVRFDVWSGALILLFALFAQVAFAGNQTGQTGLLMVGDDAPELTIEKWVQGGGFARLEMGKVYVIDMWATWCVPCIAGMPRLSRLQQKYRDAGLVVVGVTNEDGYGNTYERVAGFVRKKGPVIGYAVAWAPASTNKENLRGIFVHPWMQAIGSMNLPTAFIVDRNGKIAYIGDPSTIDEPLDDIIHGRHDLASLKADYQDVLKAQNALEIFKAALGANNVTGAIAAGNEILTSFRRVNPVTFLELADTVAKMEGKVDDRLLEIALSAGRRGVVLTQFESPGFLSALASVYAAKRDYISAVINMKAAISVSEGGMKEAQIKELEKYLSLVPRK